MGERETFLCIQFCILTLKKNFFSCLKKKKILKITESHILNGRISWYVNYISAF